MELVGDRTKEQSGRRLPLNVLSHRLEAYDNAEIKTNQVLWIETVQIKAQNWKSWNKVIGKNAENSYNKIRLSMIL